MGRNAYRVPRPARSPARGSRTDLSSRPVPTTNTPPPRRVLKVQDQNSARRLRTFAARAKRLQSRQRLTTRGSRQPGTRPRLPPVTARPVLFGCIIVCFCVLCVLPSFWLEKHLFFKGLKQKTFCSLFLPRHRVAVIAVSTFGVAAAAIVHHHSIILAFFSRVPLHCRSSAISYRHGLASPAATVATRPVIALL